MEKNQFQHLLHKYFSGDISEKEQYDLDELLKDESYAEEFKTYARLNKRISELSYKPTPAKKKKAILDTIMRDSGTGTKGKVYMIPVFFKYAAAVVILLGLGFIMMNKWSNTPDQLIVEDNPVILHLSDTLIKSLQETDYTMINASGDVQVEQAGDTIKYMATGKEGTLAYNEIDVPHGKTAVLVLSDGSRVTLNAGTWLKFPRNAGVTSTREVYVKGEAYFDVARDTSRPFVVHADDVNIRVLGTHFNVNNYESDTTVNTVLVEGKVALYADTDLYNEEKSLVIHPGTIAVFDRVGQPIATHTVDTSLYTSWMQGQLIFEGAHFSEIIRSLERKFNVEIENRNSGLEKEKFTAKFEEESIEQILKSFQQSYPFEYTIKKNKIIIN
ncbi:FecR family protein [Sinomicrobium sp. M5D2P17]